MKKSIILLVAAVTFLALGITTHAGKPVDENGTSFGNRFPSGYHYNLNILGKQGQITYPTPEYVDGTQVYRSVIFIDLYYVDDEAGNDIILLGLVDCSGTATFSSDEITPNITSTKI